MKIDLSDVKKQLISYLVSEGIVDYNTSTLVVEKLIKLVSQELVCHKCEGMFPDDNFYKSKANPSRRFRQSVCKTCFKMVYR